MADQVKQNLQKAEQAAGQAVQAAGEAVVEGAKAGIDAAKPALDRAKDAAGQAVDAGVAAARPVIKAVKKEAEDGNFFSNLWSNNKGLIVGGLIGALTVVGGEGEGSSLLGWAFAIAAIYVGISHDGNKGIMSDIGNLFSGKKEPRSRGFNMELGDANAPGQTVAVAPAQQVEPKKEEPRKDEPRVIQEARPVPLDPKKIAGELPVEVAPTSAKVPLTKVDVSTSNKIISFMINNKNEVIEKPEAGAIKIFANGGGEIFGFAVADKSGKFEAESGNTKIVTFSDKIQLPITNNSIDLTSREAREGLELLRQEATAFTGKVSNAPKDIVTVTTGETVPAQQFASAAEILKTAQGR